VGTSALNSRLPPQAGFQAKYKLGVFLMIFYFCFVACSRRSAHIRWEDTSDNEEGFRIYRVTGDVKAKIAEVGRNVTIYVDTDALPKACYLVTAFNAAGESDPSHIACLP
jgi:hypothetical protein